MKTYTFSERSGLKQVTIRNGQRIRHEELTPATYRRFATLANSGRYQVTICEDGGDRMGWELRRRQDKPRGRRCDYCGERALPDDIFCAAHRAAEDVLWANLPDDLRNYDTTDYAALADYYDGVSRGQHD